MVAQAASSLPAYQQASFKSFFTIGIENFSFDFIDPQWRLRHLRGNRSCLLPSQSWASWWSKKATATAKVARPV